MPPSRIPFQNLLYQQKKDEGLCEDLSDPSETVAGHWF